MKNEQGLTLIELLAAIALFSVVMGVAYGVVSSIHLYMGQTEDIYQKKSNVVLTESILTKYLSAPIEIRYDTSDPNLVNLTFKTFHHECYALQFDTLHHDLSLYQSNIDNLDFFTYSDKLSTVTDIANVVLENTNHQDVSGVLDQSQLYFLSITYIEKNTKISGAQATSKETIEYTLKPFRLNK